MQDFNRFGIVKPQLRCNPKPRVHLDVMQGSGSLEKPIYRAESKAFL